MNLKRYLVLLILLLCCSVSKAQSLNLQSDSIAWSVDGMTDLDADVTVPYQCKFVTRGSQNVDWIQEDGNFVLQFSVTAITGDWSNPAENGTITFSVNGEGLTGQLTISRSTDGLLATLHLSGGTHEINHKYPVASYEKI